MMSDVQQGIFIFIVLLLASPFIAVTVYYLYRKAVSWSYLLRATWLLRKVVWIKIKVWFRKKFNIKIDKGDKDD